MHFLHAMANIVLSNRNMGISWFFDRTQKTMTKPQRFYVIFLMGKDAELTNATSRGLIFKNVIAGVRQPVDQVFQ